MSRPAAERKIPVTISMSLALKSALEAEAWESQRSLADYVRGLLERRGKWARSMNSGGGYDLQADISRKVET